MEPIATLYASVQLYLRNPKSQALSQTVIRDVTAFHSAMDVLDATDTWAMWEDTYLRYLLRTTYISLKESQNDIYKTLDTQDATTKKELRQQLSIIDRVLNVLETHFTSLKGKIPRCRFITDHFDKFIEGITYFYDSRNTYRAQPVYHRLTSCGLTKDEHYTTFHTCYTANPNNKEAEKRIKTCYLERLIYDCMYKDQVLHFPNTIDSSWHAEQDKGHRNWIRKTKADFRTCYPNTSISVSIPRYKNDKPLELHVVIKEKKRIVEDMYYTRSLDEKDDYKPDVYVERKNLVTGNREHKLQTFLLEANTWYPMMEENGVPAECSGPQGCEVSAFLSTSSSASRASRKKFTTVPILSKRSAFSFPNKTV